MLYENRIIDILEFAEQPVHYVDEDIVIDKCIINKLSIPGGYCRGHVKIVNSIINEFCAVGRYFEGGLVLSNCIINQSITFEAGGHNKEAIIIENNVFTCFVDFLDAHFDGRFIFRNNILLAGSNLLGNKKFPFATLFNAGIVEENNIGNLYMPDGK